MRTAATGSKNVSNEIASVARAVDDAHASAARVQDALKTMQGAVDALCVAALTAPSPASVLPRERPGESSTP